MDKMGDATAESTLQVYNGAARRSVLWPLDRILPHTNQKGIRRTAQTQIVRTVPSFAR